ncbi:neuronal acetylcholine receptor subunit alpha-10-like isoform X2 [Mizuhopecten yessoensis]|nr:neuronal acetylcholine receptor subunit alpha-10-like isoform X2 [Mizuhopecten yessoensis]
MDLGLRQLIDLDEPVQLLKISVWIRLSWHDCRLVLNETEHDDGPTTRVVPESSVWTPDIEVYDSVSDDIRRERDFHVSINSTGSVIFNFQAVITSRCTVDVTSFPFDEQMCSLTFGSWAYNDLDMDLHSKRSTGDLNTLVPNVEWTVENFTATRHEQTFDCCEHPFPSVCYKIHMKRKPNFYVINLILPSMFVMTLTISVLIVPVESGEKLSFAVSLLLALAVFQLMLADNLPPSAETVPLIAGYFAISEGLVSFVCLMTIVVLNIHYKGEKELPVWVRRLFLGYLGRIVCVTQTRDLEKSGISNKATGTCDSKNNHTAIKNTIGNNHATVQHRLSGESQHNTMAPPTLTEEWKTVAVVVERTTAILFVSALVIVSVYVFVRLAG